MAKSPVFWIWIGATAVAALANVVWARDQNALGPMALVAINLAAMLMTAVFVGTAMLRGTPFRNFELRRKNYEGL